MGGLDPSGVSSQPNNHMDISGLVGKNPRKISCWHLARHARRDSKIVSIVLLLTNCRISFPFIHGMQQSLAVDLRNGAGISFGSKRQRECDFVFT